MPGPETLAGASARAGFFEKTVLGILRRMNTGELELELPAGNTVRFGTPGARPHARVRVKRADFFRKCLLYGDIGFGESFVDGDWETPDLTAVVAWLILNTEPLMRGGRNAFFFNVLHAANKLLHVFRPNTVEGSRKNIQAHYDLGNEFFELFLDPTMMYSSAYFATGGESLQEAQERKCEEMCRKLLLSSRDHVLEIGSGWGGFALHAAKRYGCRVTTITVSRRQHDYALRRVREAGLEGKIQVVFTDYRHVEGVYDKIVSIEMIEAVGHKYFDAYFRQCHRLLAKDGLLGLQMILIPDDRYEEYRKSVDWVQKHIFPGGLLPSFEEIYRAIRRTGDLHLQDYDDLTPSYARTLAAWRDRLMAARGSLPAGSGFDEFFLRKWDYYFSYCEAAFRTRNISVVQAVFSRTNNLALNPAGL